MKIPVFETMNLLALAATMAVGVFSSPPSSHPFFENYGTEPGSRDLISDECCRSCEIKQERIGSTMSSAMHVPAGDKGFSKNRNVRSDSNGYNHHREDYNSDGTSPRVIRILTWDEPKSALQAYVDSYRKSRPDAPTIRIESVPSLQDLDYEVTNELQSPSAIIDGFVVPPAFIGGMYKMQGGHGLANWTREATNNYSPIEDLLPYYRYNVATFDGIIRGLPIMAGSQAMILFRKDYLDALNLPTPKTWEHWTTLAAAVSNAEPPLLGGGPDGPQSVYGACMGLLSEAGCRKRKSLNGQPCRSQTMSYLGMMLASMTQYEGNTTGFMVGIDNTTRSGIDPLFQPTLTRILKWMENQVRSSRLRSLMEDAHDSMNNFRAGRCAWTISIDHDNELLRDKNIGFVPLPGSKEVLDRSGVVGTIGKSAGESKSPSGGSRSHKMVSCTESCDENCELLGIATLCPYGKEIENFGFVNQVPFGAVDATIGTVSGLVSPTRQEEVKKFYTFVLASGVGDSVPGHDKVQQPLTYSDLKKSDIQNYDNTMKKLTRNPNAAIPFRIPNAFNLLLDLDDRVYDYLLEGDYSEARREEVALSAEQSWQMMIAMYDARGQMKDNLPTSYFHKQSLGVHVPLPASDLYIGWTVRGTIWAFAGLSCLTSIAFAFVVWVYEGERVIRASQPVFLYLICAGTFFMTLSVFTLGIEDDIAPINVILICCYANYWLYSLGFTAVISALFTKIWMAAKVLNMPRNEQRIQITHWDILGPFMAIFGIDFILLFLWTTSQRHEWVRSLVYASDPDLYALNIIEESTQGWCESTQGDWKFALLLLFNYLTVILALVQAYECRRITTEYAESMWITIAIYVFAQAWLIGFPVVMLVHYDPKKDFLLKSCLVLITSFTVLLLIFVPKTVYLCKALRESGKAESNQEPSQDFPSQIGDSANSSSSPGTGTIGRKDPKGTIGIRIVQSTCLNPDEVNELQDAVDKAEQRNKMLRDTKEKLKENLEERRYAGNQLLNSSTSSKTSGKKSNEDSLDIGSMIVKAKPNRYRTSHETAHSYLS